MLNQSNKDGYVHKTIPIDMENSIHIKSNDNFINIKLQLKGDKPREIGTVSKSTKTIAMKRVRSKHLFRKVNAYGFNDYILRESKSFEWISLSDDLGNSWKVPKKYILEHGKYLNFKQQGFELQRFVSLSELEQFRVINDL